MSISQLDISSEHLAIVQQILRQLVPSCEVWAFGSRVKGAAKPFSDLDLVVMSQQPLPLALMASLSEAFSESDLPWKVDIVDWSTTSPDFKAVIDQQKVKVQAVVF
ncbi:nucleotidyltransferase domain-containing protein [Rheinheimera sediminis]|uniref:nucleotidyltransferase family protein n=1 Tax=Rheinheimera sp. YQF-1 TaxID=2499626 RepID=UPI000FDCB01B|nr:nucleotidyltransferase domain-containing protein [Rheinheimera sp. YQF-1]RVT47626.1 nucleotidyltransferase domain-containing protein [Rheinheimera sp. YQF-1]